MGLLLLPVACPDGVSWWSNLSRITPALVIVMVVAVGILLAGCLFAIWRDAFRRQSIGNFDSAPDISGRLAMLWLSAFSLVVFASKLFVLRQYPVTTPYWDQWNGEAAWLYIPLHDCSLDWSTMFSLHNEHRVFFTRLLALALLIVDGQWDPRLQQVINAAMHTLTGVLFVVALWVANGRRRLDLFVFVAALTFALPFAWENTLLGFQSAFYFLLLFSFLALWLTIRHLAGSLPWLLGWMCAVCALFTAASGFVVAIAIVSATTLKSISDGRGWRPALANGVAAAAVVAAGIWLMSPPLPGHDFLRAKTAADFSGALARNLAWPWIDDKWFALLMWLPGVLSFALVVLRRLKTTELERLTVALGVWVLIHAAAFAQARGAGAPAPATRYMDFLSIGFLINTTALVATLGPMRSGIARRLAVGVGASWLIFATVGLGRLVSRTVDDLKGWSKVFATESASVRRFVISGNLADFVSRPALYEIPYPDANALAGWLQHPFIRQILPAAVRAPLHVESRSITGDAFVSEPQAWSSRSASGIRAVGRFESQPLWCRAGNRLKFEVSGGLGGPKHYLALKTLQAGRDAPIVPAHAPGEAWTDAYVRCPSGMFEIIAIDANPESWFAFREPVEIGSASVVAETLIGWSQKLLFVAAGMILLAASWTYAAGSRTIQVGGWAGM